MTSTDSIFHRNLNKLLIEIFEGPPGQEAYILNPGDVGLLRQLETISAATASARPAPNKPSIAAHVDHLEFGLSLLTRWANGEENPWATADWNGSWNRNTVTEEQWRDLRNRLRSASEAWRKFAGARTEWGELDAAGALSSLAHTAYHLGAIRQILTAVSK